jgi:hypothetical protein
MPDNTMERTQELIHEEENGQTALEDTIISDEPLGDSYMETSNNDPNLNLDNLKKSDYF